MAAVCHKDFPMTLLSIPGMSCGHCKDAVEAALAGVPGVATVRVDLEARQAALDGTAEAPALLAALDRAGYPAVIAG